MEHRYGELQGAGLQQGAWGEGAQGSAAGPHGEKGFFTTADQKGQGGQLGWFS